MSEQEQWDAWERGETRCPICIGLDDRDFEAVCDCSRYSLETTGKPLVFQVIGHPETATTVMPERIVMAAAGAYECPRCSKLVVLGLDVSKPEYEHYTLKCDDPDCTEKERQDSYKAMVT